MSCCGGGQVFKDEIDAAGTRAGGLCPGLGAARDRDQGTWPLLWSHSPRRPCWVCSPILAGHCLLPSLPASTRLSVCVRAPLCAGAAVCEARLGGLWQAGVDTGSAMEPGRPRSLLPYLWPLYFDFEPHLSQCLSPPTFQSPSLPLQSPVPTLQSPPSLPPTAPTLPVSNHVCTSTHRRTRIHTSILRARGMHPSIMNARVRDRGDAYTKGRGAGGGASGGQHLGHVTGVCGKHLGHVPDVCGHRPRKWRSTLRRRSCGCRTLVVLDARHDAWRRAMTPIKHVTHAARISESRNNADHFRCVRIRKCEQKKWHFFLGKTEPGSTPGSSGTRKPKQSSKANGCGLWTATVCVCFFVLCNRHCVQQGPEGEPGGCLPTLRP